MSTSNILSKKRKLKLKNFQKKYNLNFKDIELLNRAFCHSSYVFENSLDENLSYERLEFLGDAVLKLAISEILYEQYPSYQEGKLSKIRSQTVSDRNISKYARLMDFEDLIILGKNEKSQGGSKKESILACAFEALLGAIFLEYDKNGYKKALEFLKENFLEDILSIEEMCDFLNPKAVLQEYTQGLNSKLPEYITTKEEGPEHDKTFYVDVKYNNKIIGTGCAKSIKAAQQKAALEAIEKLKIKPQDK